MNTTETKPTTTDPDTGSPDDMAHYARNADIARAAVLGTEITALCGVKFKPLRDPEQFPVCEQCKFLLGQLADQHGGPTPN